MNFTNDGSHYGITQYRWPLDYELAGRSFLLRGERGTYALRFRDRGFVECNGVLSQYEALKLESDLHVVFFGETVTAAALDLTRGIALVGGDPEGSWEACRLDGFAPDAALPGPTDEMTGTHVRWMFGCERYAEHTYLPEGKCKTVWSPRTDRERTARAAYFKLSEGRYLVELDRCSPFRTDMPQGFSRMILVQDYEHLLTVGCVYSPILNEFRLISGYAMQP